MKKRLAIAKALLHEPKLLFLDEPTNGLDPDGIRDMIGYLRKLNEEQGTTILICSHVLHQLEDVCSSYLFIDQGRLIEKGTLEELERKYAGKIVIHVKTGLRAGSSELSGYQVREAGEQLLEFHLQDEQAISDLLRLMLRISWVHEVQIMNRSLESIYFEVRRRCMNYNKIIAIADKDMKMTRKTGKVWISLILLPLILGVLIPAAIVSIGRWADILALGNGRIMLLLEHLSIPDKISMPTVNHRFVYFMTQYMLVPIFMLIPVINAMMIAVNSFVGEKERRTLESLLFAPIEIKDLFIGKLLASFIPAYASTLASFLVGGIIMNVLAYPMFGSIIFPSLNWFILLFWVIPVFTISAILFSVLVSARSKAFRKHSR